MILASIFSVPAIQPAHATTAGTVCLALDGSTACPSVPQLFTVPQAQTTLRVAVFVQGSSPGIGAFDITIAADNATLRPTGVDTSQSILPGIGIITECLQGKQVIGVNGCLITDTANTLHLGAVSGVGTVSTTGTGILFTALYNIVGTTTGTSLDFQTGCPEPSVSPNICVFLTTGTGIVETGSSFANLQNFNIAASPNPLGIPPGTTATSTITLTSVGGYHDFVGASITSSNIPATLTLNPTCGCIDLTSSNTGTATLTVGPAATGSYSVTVTATGTGFLNPSNKPTNPVTVIVNVAPRDFQVSAQPTSLTIARGNQATSTITVTGISGFTGTVTLSTMVTTSSGGAASGISVMYSPPSVMNSGTSTATISVASSAALGSYTVTVKGNNSTSTMAGVTRSAQIAITVPAGGFSVVVLPGDIGIPRASNGFGSINLASLNNFAGTVTLTATVTAVPNQQDSAGLTSIASLLKDTSLRLSAGGTNSTTATVFTIEADATGNYTLTVTGVSGPITQVFNAPVMINDFLLTVVHPVITVTTETVAQGGLPANTKIDVHSLGGYQSGSSNGVAGVNPELPARGTFVPELGFRVCISKTFFANGTQIPYSYLKANGPIADGGSPDGCRFSSITFPGPGVDDFFFPEVQSLNHTQPGTYIVEFTARALTLIHSVRYTVVVVATPLIHQWVFPHTFSLSKSGNVLTFKFGLSNPLGNPTIYVLPTVTLADSAGNTFTLTASSVVAVPSGGNANNIALSVNLAGFAGDTFTVTVSMTVGVDPALLTGFATTPSSTGVPVTASLVVLT